MSVNGDTLKALAHLHQAKSTLDLLIASFPKSGVDPLDLVCLLRTRAILLNLINGGEIQANESLQKATRAPPLFLIASSALSKEVTECRVAGA